MKKSATAIIGLLAAVIVSAAVYELFNVNSAILGKSDQSQVSNYSAEIGSLKPQINSLSNNVSSLGSLKGDISDIRGKLSDLESKINQAQQVALASAKPVIILDKSTYLQGDVAYVTAVGLDPQKAVKVQLLDNYGYVIMQTQTRPDSTGRLTYNLSLPSAIITGNYQVKVVSGLLSVSQPITIVERSYNSGSVTLSGVSVFNAQTDQAVYLPSDVIQVFGTGAPNTSVSGVLTSPSGKTYTSNAAVQPDGTFTIYYTDSQPLEQGTWHVTLNNQGVTKVLYLSVQSGGSSNSYPFTAQTDFVIYSPGDQIRVSGIAQPYTTVSAALTSPSGKTYTTTSMTSSDGSYQLYYFTSQWYETGYWNINLTNDGATRGFSIYMSSTSPSPYSFTAQTDKTIYTKGEQIQITGEGKSYTTVKASLTSPSGTTYNTAVSTNFDRSYVISFPTSSSYETGNWYITITNWGLTKVISIYLEPRT